MVPMGSGESAVELPSKLVVTRGPGTFEIAWKWRDQVPRGAFFAPLVPMVGIINGVFQAFRASAIAGLAGLTIIAGVLGLMALAWAKNTVRVRVARGAITIAQGPVRIGGTRELDVVSVVATAPPTRKKKPPSDERWAVLGTRPNGGTVNVVAHMLPRAQAEEIARHINDALRPPGGAGPQS